MFPIFELVDATGTLGSRVSRIHTYLKSRPDSEAISRISLAVYDHQTGLVQTLAFSNTKSVKVGNLALLLREVPSLEALAQKGSYRVIDDVLDAYDSARDHSSQIIESGVRSSLTYPVRTNGSLIGFVFINANQPGYFTQAKVEVLCPIATILSMMLVGDLLRAVREVVAT